MYEVLPFTWVRRRVAQFGHLLITYKAPRGLDVFAPERFLMGAGAGELFVFSGGMVRGRAVRGVLRVIVFRGLSELVMKGGCPYGTVPAYCCEK